MKEFRIPRLAAGGVITNYHCTSSCRHCLYACGPKRKKDYIDRDTLEENLRKIKSMGCRSVHVGGGEPFLNEDGLAMVLETCASQGVCVEYVETNSSWYRDEPRARQLLGSLRKLGLSTLLVSMSPFHAEHIPFFKVKGVVEACRRTGVGVFAWSSEFYPEIDALGDEKTHRLSEFAERYGSDYLDRIPSRYWVHFGGRAVETFAPVFGLKLLEQILSENRGGCRELADTSHFHLDLHGHYIPGLCSGLAAERDDLGKPLSPGKYPLLTTLYSSGISGLLDMAAEDFGFAPENAYFSKCHLCLSIRKYLAEKPGFDTVELRPEGFYENV